MNAFDKFPWLGWAIIVLGELIALAVGVALWWFGHIAWYVAPLFLLAPPTIVAISGVLGLASAEARGENPFQ